MCQFPGQCGSVPSGVRASSTLSLSDGRRAGCIFVDSSLRSCHTKMTAVRYAVTVGVVAYLTFAFFRYLDTHVPEGVPEVWHARILDASLRTAGSVILTLNDLGLPGGITWWTRGIVNVMMTSLITGSPFGLGQDPELKIYDTQFDGVDVRVYEPTSLKGDNRSVLVYYHGGGWSWLSVDVYDPATRALAKRTPMVVVSVGYRQSPEHAHPIPFEDCLHVTEYVIKNARDLKVDPARVAISGDSAGGHLTAAVALRLGKQIKLQVPIYPCLQLLDLQTPSYIENKQYIPGMLNDMSMLSYWMNYGNISYDHMDKFLANKHTSPKVKQSKYAQRISPQWYMPEHIRTPALRAMIKADNFGDEELWALHRKTLLDPYFAPLMASDEQLKTMAPAYVLTAGYDVLRDDGLIYAQRLRSVNVPVKLAHYTEGFHGMIFFINGPIPFEVGRRGMSDLVTYLKENV